MTFVLAPLPNAVFSRCGGDDFSAEYDGSGPVDLGRFITASVVVTGFALPLVLAHDGADLARDARGEVLARGGPRPAVELVRVREVAAVGAEEGPGDDGADVELGRVEARGERRGERHARVVPMRGGARFRGGGRVGSVVVG